MLKSIRNIIILLFVVLSIWGIFLGIGYNIIHSTINVLDKIVQNTNIVINNNKIEVLETYSFQAKYNQKRISLQRTLYVNEEDSEYKCKKPENVKVYLNNKLLKDNRNAKMAEANYYLSNTGVVIQNIDVVKNSKYHIKINYEYSNADAIIEYTNLATLKLITDEYITENNIKIQLPKETKVFKLDSNAKIKYLENNTYSIKGDMKSPYSILLMDKGIATNTKIVNEEYETSNIKRTLMSEDPEIIRVLIIMLTITLTSFVITIVITRKPRIKKNYVRNVEEVIEPILAESIIDRKIGVKELIMSCIVELIYRGNLKNIGNDKIQLIHGENVSKYELEILNMLFKGRNQIITFEQIKDIFINNNQKTQDFFDRFNNVKKKIEEKLFKCDIYSKTGEKILKILRVISVVGIINIVYAFYRYYQGDSIDIYIMFCSTIIATVFAIFLDYDTKINSKSVNTRNTGKGGIALISLLLCIVIWMIFEGDKHVGTLIIIGVIFVMNILTYIKTKSHILTEKGKYELAKAQGLKDYIQDYSLMKERELDSVIIWDEYLAYAVAFGIPNKITEKFGENLMNANILLQKIENILKM